MSRAFEPRDIKPNTQVRSLQKPISNDGNFESNLVSAVTGMSLTFISKVVGTRNNLSMSQVLELLDQDAFSETFIPRSMIPSFLENYYSESVDPDINSGMHCGSVLDLLPRLADQSIDAVVTSTPYWAMRLYEDMKSETWADGENCPFGMEQTPESFIRHSVEILWRLQRKVSSSGSVWWNLGDTYNTRTQIRSNASEALKAMQGQDDRSWNDYEMRRYSAGHSFLFDGEQALIPFRIAERASRIGYLVKSMITWVKPSTTPEPQNSRVSRTTEQIIHLTLQRTPKFNKDAYLSISSDLGGRGALESAKLTDAWLLNTSSGSGGHGAQFPIALPGRCIAISTNPGDVVLDPFMGSGTTAVAAERLGRSWIGFDTSAKYVEITNSRVSGSN